MTQLGKPSGRIRVPGEAALQISWAAQTNVGLVRERNEDSLLADGTVFAVADGMGGHLAGDLASTAIVKGLVAQRAQFPVRPQAVFEALLAASDAVRGISSESGGSSGSTITGVALTRGDDGDPAWLVFNIGDSRVYVFAEGELTQVTHDHSVVQELMDAGRITPDEALEHPDRNAITRAIGFNMNPKPDFWLLNLVTGMRFLVCSDGLFKEVPVEEIAQVLSTLPGPSDAAGELVQAAIDNGGRDNVSVVVVAVDAAPEPAEQPEPVRPQPVQPAPQPAAS